jgi:hypothetical protein
MRARFRFSIREVLLVTVIVSLSVGWWFDRRRLVEEISAIKPLLQPASTIEGRVTYGDSGRPAIGVTVFAQANSSHVHGNRATWGKTKTDDAGHYQLVNLAPANWNILVDVNGWTAVAIDSLPVVAGQAVKDADLQLIKGSLIKGRVVDEDTRKPIDWAGQRIAIGVYGPARPKTGGAVHGGMADKRGEFQIQVAAGRNYPYIMSVQPSWVFEGKEYLDEGILVEDGKATEIEFSIKVPRGAGPPPTESSVDDR